MLAMQQPPGTEYLLPYLVEGRCRSNSPIPDILFFYFTFIYSWTLPCYILLSGEGNGTQLQYSCLGNPMDRGAWQAVVHGVVKSWTWFHFHFHFSLSCIGEGNGNSSVLAWRIPGTGEPGGLLSMGSHRVGLNWSDSAAAGKSGML